MTSLVTDAQLWTVGMAACRIAGVCLAAPVLASRAVPRRIALAFAVALAVASLPSLAAAHYAATIVPGGVGTFITGAGAELLTGGVLGFMAALPIIAVRSAGALAGVQMGIGFGGLYGDTDGAGSGSTDVEGTDGVEMLLGMAAVAIFVAFGGLDSLALGVLRSFDYVPLATWPSIAGLPTLLGHGFLACSELALRVAMPVTVVLVAEVLVTGLVSRAIPSLGPVQFGFPLRVVIGLLALIAGGASMQDALSGASATALDAAHAWMVGGAS